MICPKHIAIIMDGNGRWGLKKKKTRNFGHKEGIKTVKKIINSSIKKNIQYLTLYAFSTENWKRPIKEINYLLNLLENFIDTELKNLIKKGIKLKVIGELNKFNKKLKDKIKHAEKVTNQNINIQVNIALNYGARRELINSFKNIKKKKLPINEKNICKFLYTSNVPDPDILIRTGGKKRLSNFMSWQLIYSEIFFINKLWPEFNEKDFYKILKLYNIVKRNFGGL